MPAVVEPDLTGLVTTDHDLIVTNQTAIANQTPVFIKANYPVYDQAKCERDTGFIIDAISHDVQYTGNRATLANAGFYFVNGINTLPSLQRVSTKAAYLRLAEVMSQVVTETLVTVSSGNAEVQDTSGLPATATEATTVTELGTIIANAVAADTPANLPARR